MENVIYIFNIVMLCICAFVIIGLLIWALLIMLIESLRSIKRSGTRYRTQLKIRTHLKIQGFYQPRKEKWDSFSPTRKSLCAVACFIFIAIAVVIAYEVIYNFTAGSADPKHLFEEALSNTYRNRMLLGFAIFGICLAVWARWANERHLQYTQEQLENSAKMNRNDRFAKAVELIDSRGGLIATRGGLYILRDLASEKPETEYIRCVEIISHFLIQDDRRLKITRGKHDDMAIKDNLLDIAVGIFRIGNPNRKLKGIIEEYKEKNDWDYWPNLQGANLTGLDLQTAYLVGAYLKGAIFEGTNLEDADLTDAYMKDAITLGVDQISLAKWRSLEGGKRPQLSGYLENAPELQEWLNNPNNKIKITFKNKRKGKKYQSTGRKLTSVKSLTRNPKNRK